MATRGIEATAQGKGAQEPGRLIRAEPWPLGCLASPMLGTGVCSVTQVRTCTHTWSP